MPEPGRVRADRSTESGPGLAQTNTMFARVGCPADCRPAPKEEHAPLRDRAALDVRGALRAGPGRRRSRSQAPRTRLSAARRTGEVTPLARPHGRDDRPRRYPVNAARDEFRLKLLFETGTCVFSTPTELCTLLDRPAGGSVRDRPRRRRPAEQHAPPEPPGRQPTRTRTRRRTADTSAPDAPTSTQIRPPRKTTPAAAVATARAPHRRERSCASSRV